MRAAAIKSGESELDNFLYAPICEDSEGITLTVLSAIARQDIDPWTEASRLSELPKDTSVNQIIALLNTLPQRIGVSLDKVELASRLSVLLPRHAAAIVPELSGGPTTKTMAPAAYYFNWRFFCIYLGFMLLFNWLMNADHAPTASVASSSSPINSVGTPSTTHTTGSAGSSTR